jgi:hypothetical protein
MFLSIWYISIMDNDINKLFTAGGMAMLCGVLNIATLALLANAFQDVEQAILLSMVLIAPVVEESMRWIAAKMKNVVFFTISIITIESMLNFTSGYGLVWRLVPSLMHALNAYILCKTADKRLCIRTAGYAAAVTSHVLYNATVYILCS